MEAIIIAPELYPKISPALASFVSNIKFSVWNLGTILDSSLVCAAELKKQKQKQKTHKPPPKKPIPAFVLRLL